MRPYIYGLCYHNQNHNQNHYHASIEQHGCGGVGCWGGGGGGGGGVLSV